MDYTAIGSNIKRFRKGLMTQAELAQKIGKSVSSVKKYELGLVEIPNSVIEQIALALNIKVSALVPLENDPFFELEKRLPDGYSIGGDEENGSIWLRYPDGGYSRELSLSDLQELVNKTLDYMSYELEKLRRPARGQKKITPMFD